MQLRILLLFLIVFLTIIIIGACELEINTSRPLCSGDIPDRYAVIKHQKLKNPVYIINTDRVREGNFNINDYNMIELTEHVISKFYRRFSSFASRIKNNYKTKTPINTVFMIIGKSDEILNTINPMTSLKNDNFRIYKHKDDHVEAFIYNNKFYII
jgi:hypothetical protein